MSGNTFSGINTFNGQTRWSKGADLASASTLVLGTDGNYFDVTGTTSISGITAAAGTLFMLQFAGVLTITDGASLKTHTGANVITAAGDRLVAFATGTGAVEILSYVHSAGDLHVPVSNSGEPGLHFGAEPSGETGFGIHTGTENKLRGYVQDVESMRLSSGGGISSWAFNSIGSQETIDNNDVYSVAFGTPGSSPDRSAVMLLSTPISTGENVAGLIYYRSASDHIEILVQSAAGKLDVATGVLDGNDGASDKITVSVDKVTDTLYIENRLGQQTGVVVTFFGQGAGMTTI